MLNMAVHVNHGPHSYAGLWLCDTSWPTSMLLRSRSRYDQGRCGHWKLDLHKKLCLLVALGDPGVYKQDL